MDDPSRSFSHAFLEQKGGAKATSEPSEAYVFVLKTHVGTRVRR